MWRKATEASSLSEVFLKNGIYKFLEKFNWKKWHLQRVEVTLFSKFLEIKKQFFEQSTPLWGWFSSLQVM